MEFRAGGFRPGPSPRTWASTRLQASPPTQALAALHCEGLYLALAGGPAGRALATAEPRMLKLSDLDTLPRAP
ncbi:hypothetical protein [Corallococcus exercitus]|uniref:hypothetical protein n=1 Tax=Corallococcus exercitus TaxID=2316736 RepID=UPI001C11EEEF|nr:hypothetical protein [Corallococcus exercitus]